MRRAKFACAVGLTCALGCGVPSDLSPTRAIPPLAPLQKVADVIGNESFVPSGAASTENCEIVLVGSQWGTWVRILRDGRTESVAGTIPGGRRITRLESKEGMVVAWSENTPFAGIINTNLAVDSFVLPRHPWGPQWAGPIAVLGGGLLAIAPLGDPAVKRRRPERWVETPAALIVDRRGQIINRLGVLRDTTGMYLPWLSARVAIGALGDTVLALALSDAVLTKYYPTSSAGWAGPVGTSSVLLPRYVATIPRVEEVRSLPWIQRGGDFIAFLDAPHVATATFDDRGRVYAVRNYAFKWRPKSGTLFSTRGQWVVDRQGLEIYSSEGTLLSAVKLPPRGVSWVRVVRDGRLLLRTGERSLVIARNPVDDREMCLDFGGPVIQITALDAPPRR